MLHAASRPRINTFFSTLPSTWGGSRLRIDTHPRRRFPIRTATFAPTTPLGPDNPPQGRSIEPTSRVHPNLGHNTPYTIPIRPLKIAELCVGLVNGLEAFLKVGFNVTSYTWADPSTFDRKQCILIIFELGFCQDFGCHKRLQEKTAKYAPLVAALRTV